MCRRRAQRPDLRVRGRVAALMGALNRAPDHLTLPHDHGTHRHLAKHPALRREGQRFAHVQ